MKGVPGKKQAKTRQGRWKRVGAPPHYGRHGKKTCSFQRPCITVCTTKFSDLPPALQVLRTRYPQSTYLRIKNRALDSATKPKAFTQPL